MNIRHITWISAVALFFAGCGAPNPATLAIEERDKALYVDEGAETKQREEKFPVAVLVLEQNPSGAVGTLVPEIESLLGNAVNDMAFLRLVERSDMDVLMQEKAFAALGQNGEDLSQDIGFLGADYLIIAKVRSSQSAPVVQTETSSDEKGRKETSQTTRVTVTVSMNFRFYEIATQKILVSKDFAMKSYTFTSSGATFTDQAAIDKRMTRVVKNAVRSFVLELGSRCAPRGRVIETRGDCLVAKINQGANYGILPGVKVEFYEIVDNSAIDPDLKRDESIVGRGTVFHAGRRFAWVEVEDYEDVHVKKGDYVKISADQSKGFMEVISQQVTESWEDAQ